MTIFTHRHRLALLAGAAAISGPARGLAQGATMQGQPTPSDLAAMAKAKSDSVNRPYTNADIDFMRGMIAHHAQALVMAGWARSHGASLQSKPSAIASSTRRRMRSTSCRLGCVTAANPCRMPSPFR